MQKRKNSTCRKERSAGAIFWVSAGGEAFSGISRPGQDQRFLFFVRQPLECTFAAHGFPFVLKGFRVSERYRAAGTGVFCAAPQIVRADARFKVGCIAGIERAVRTAEDIGVVHRSVAQVFVNQHKMKLGEQVWRVFDDACHLAHALCGCAVHAFAGEGAGGGKAEPPCVGRADLPLDAGDGLIQAAFYELVLADEQDDFLRPRKHSRHAVARAIDVHEPAVTRDRICGAYEPIRMGGANLRLAAIISLPMPENGIAVILKRFIKPEFRHRDGTSETDGMISNKGKTDLFRFGRICRAVDDEPAFFKRFHKFIVSFAEHDSYTS